jgi:hypothetical protein
MKSNQRNLAIGIAVLLAIIVFSLFSIGGSHIVIDGEEMNGMGGIAGLVLGCVLAFVALVLALSLTGLVLAGVAILLVLVLAVVLGSVAFAMLPLLIPFLILYALISLFTRKKTA